jgi:hypothetical protein
VKPGGVGGGGMLWGTGPVGSEQTAPVRRGGHSGGVSCTDSFTDSLAAKSAVSSLESLCKINNLRVLNRSPQNS